jgi:hypothetical protein
VNALIVPTTMMAARPLAAIDASSETCLDYNVNVHRKCGVGNILNFWAMSVPCWFTSGGLPIGLMIYAMSFAECHGQFQDCHLAQWHQGRRPVRRAGSDRRNPLGGGRFSIPGAGLMKQSRTC